MISERSRDVRTKLTFPVVSSHVADYLLTDLFWIADFQQHFKDISKQHSPVPRPFYMYLTSVIVSVVLFWHTHVT